MKLNNGKDIPNIGLGTWMIKNKLAAEAVKEAIKAGYRHIDSARVYFNEKGVGEGIRQCGLKREEVFVTSKVYQGHKTYLKAMKAIDHSLRRMGLDYIDLMLIHWPKPIFSLHSKKTYFKENLDVWRAFEDAYHAGKLKAIGVSNFSIDDLENLIKHTNIKPMVNQIKIHIGHTPMALITYCQQHGIVVEAYSPIARGRAMQHKEIVDMAKKYHVSVPQLCIRYTLDLGVVTLPKTGNPHHMKDNLDVDFVISDDDLKRLKEMTLVI